tara:strand:+ start:204 stop:548 length:345 start_codon:yes stop_codon:yes gene_type:complete
MSFLSDVLPEVILTGFGGFTGWFFTRRHKRAQAKGTELDNVEKATAIWRELAEDLKSEVHKMREKQSYVLDKQDELIVENKRLTYEITKLEKKVQALTRENKKLRELLEAQQQK